MSKYKTIKDLLEAIRVGEVNEPDIRVILDNDKTTVELGYWVEGVDEDDSEEQEPLYDGKGYYDIEDLWPLILPQAKVEWC